jgi:hypothetical protein
MATMFGKVVSRFHSLIPETTVALLLPSLVALQVVHILAIQPVSWPTVFGATILQHQEPTSKYISASANRAVFMAFFRLMDTH